MHEVISRLIDIVVECVTMSDMGAKRQAELLDELEDLSDICEAKKVLLKDTFISWDEANKRLDNEKEKLNEEI